MICRTANYHNNEFLEGVSLTIYDEISRWEKYSYGCAEIVFHPMKRWIFKGPFTPLFRRFLFSDMIVSSKITILGYMMSCQQLPPHDTQKITADDESRFCSGIRRHSHPRQLLPNRLVQWRDRQILHAILEQCVFISSMPRSESSTNPAQ